MKMAMWLGMLAIPVIISGGCCSLRREAVGQGLRVHEVFLEQIDRFLTLVTTLAGEYTAKIELLGSTASSPKAALKKVENVVHVHRVRDTIRRGKKVWNQRCPKRISDALSAPLLRGTSTMPPGSGCLGTTRPCKWNT